MMLLNFHCKKACSVLDLIKINFDFKSNSNVHFWFQREKEANKSLTKKKSTTPYKSLRQEQNILAWVIVYTCKTNEESKTNATTHYQEHFKSPCCSSNS